MYHVQCEEGAFKIVALNKIVVIRKIIEILGSKAPLFFGEGLGVRSK